MSYNYLHVTWRSGVHFLRMCGVIMWITATNRETLWINTLPPHTPRAHRCVFASNFPVDRSKGTFSELISALEIVLHPYSLQDKRRFFSENAKKFYRLWQSTCTQHWLNILSIFAFKAVSMCRIMRKYKAHVNDIYVSALVMQINRMQVGGYSLSLCHYYLTTSSQ